MIKKNKTNTNEKVTKGGRLRTKGRWKNKVWLDYISIYSISIYKIYIIILLYWVFNVFFIRYIYLFEKKIIIHFANYADFKFSSTSHLIKYKFSQMLV